MLPPPLKIKDAIFHVGDLLHVDHKGAVDEEDLKCRFEFVLVVGMVPMAHDDLDFYSVFILNTKSIEKWNMHYLHVRAQKVNNDEG